MSETGILGYTRHPASSVWPELGADEYAALRDNIDAQGQDHPILVTPDRKVIDGWHRLRACAEIPLTPVTMVCHFDEHEIARKVIGAHTGRRHLTRIDIARLTIETMKACGMEHAPAHRPQKGDRSVSGAAITRETVSRDAGVSGSTARRAIREDKRRSGLLPPGPAAATRPKKPSGAAAETGTPGAPPEPGSGAAPGPEAVAGDPGPDPGSERLARVRHALDRLEQSGRADDLAGLDDGQRAEYAAMGARFAEFGSAMRRAAARVEARGAAAAPAAAVPAAPRGADPPAAPRAADPYAGMPDIPPFLDRRKPAPDAGPRKGWPGPDTLTGETWLAYAESYRGRYGAWPVWNATIAGQLAQFVRRIGRADAPGVAAFYLRREDRWYAEKMHSVAALLNDAEKLRTAWATGLKSPPDTRPDPMEQARIARQRREAREGAR